MTTRLVLIAIALGLTVLGIVRFGAWFDAQVAAVAPKVHGVAE